MTAMMMTMKIAANHAPQKPEHFSMRSLLLDQGGGVHT
jgi:hypothetical protein